jgi:hypothetical protein
VFPYQNPASSPTALPTVTFGRRQYDAGGLSPCVTKRIAYLRAERMANRKPEAPTLRAPSFIDIVPANTETDRLIDLLAERKKAEAAALAGILAFLLVTLVAFLVFGDAPGMGAAAAMAGI